jgi:2-methylcitrate dehydratase PrpD
MRQTGKILKRNIAQGRPQRAKNHSFFFNPLFAVMVNGMAGSSLEFEEGNSVATGHPAVRIVPGVLVLDFRKSPSFES